MGLLRVVNLAQLSAADGSGEPASLRKALVALTRCSRLHAQHISANLRERAPRPYSSSRLHEQFMQSDASATTETMCLRHPGARAAGSDMHLRDAERRWVVRRTSPKAYSLTASQIGP